VDFVVDFVNGGGGGRKSVEVWSKSHFERVSASAPVCLMF